MSCWQNRGFISVSLWQSVLTHWPPLVCKKQSQSYPLGLLQELLPPCPFPGKKRKFFHLVRNEPNSEEIFPAPESWNVSLVTVKQTSCRRCGLSDLNVISNVSIGLYFWGASTIGTCIHQIPAPGSARKWLRNRRLSLSTSLWLVVGWSRGSTEGSDITRHSTSSRPSRGRTSSPSRRVSRPSP